MLQYVLTRKQADNNRLTWIQASAARRLEGVKESSSRSMLTDPNFELTTASIGLKKVSTATLKINTS
ncbi:hypothetical protein Tco_0251587 [Tanacetum coccineum]